MKSKVAAFEIEDTEEMAPDEISGLINDELRKAGVDADDVISIMQPTSYSFIRVFYRKH